MIVVRERGSSALAFMAWLYLKTHYTTAPATATTIDGTKTPESKCHFNNFTACFIIDNFMFSVLYTLFILNLIFSKTRVTEIIFLHPYILKPVFGQNTELTILRNGQSEGSNVLSDQSEAIG